MEKQHPPHILLVSYPAQSHLNPALQLATRLTRSGVLVTFATTISTAKRMIKPDNTPTPAGLSFATFSDGYDNGHDSVDSSTYMAALRRRGTKTLSDLISTAGPHPYTGVVYTIILTWAADVAKHHRLPSALLWIQSATLFSVYYHYYNGLAEIFERYDENDPEWCVELPCMPPLRARDVSTFLGPSTPYTDAHQLLREQFQEILMEESHYIVLVNSFDSLEHELLEYLKPKFRILTVGPLLPDSYIGTSTTFTIDMYKRSEADYMAWLDTKPSNSVVYVSFGSISELSATQMEELAAALVEIKRPFLWVIKPGGGEDEKERVSKWEEAVGGSGMVVTWCRQVEVLRHAAVGCFVTHCGWNSTLEGLAAGVALMAVPIWADQLTNAKMVEEVWRNGVRVEGGGIGDGRVVGREEIRLRVGEVMESVEVRGNARRWRERAVDAVVEGGSSDVNVGAFVEEVRRSWCTPAAAEADRGVMITYDYT